MNEQPIQRVRHREKQPVRAEDLTAEQQYHIAMRRRHNVGLHGWGIARGLRLSKANSAGLQIEAGVAVDGYGRFLFVPHDWIVETAVLSGDPFTGGLIDVWLLYARVPEDVDGDGQLCRWRETAHVRLTAGAGDPPDPYASPFSDDPCQPYGPHVMPSDSPDEEWPLYLGRVAYSSGLMIMEVERPYASLAASHITPPTEQVKVTLGRQTATNSDRFVVSLPGEKAGTCDDQLAISHDKKFRFAAPTIMSSLSLKQGITFEQLTAVPTTASPWQIYRVQTKVEGRTVNEWRWELPAPVEDSPSPVPQLQIGFGSDRTFAPRLTVQADGKVVLIGEVEAEGTIDRGPIQPDLDEPAFMGALVETSHAALLASAAINDPEVAGLLEVAFNEPAKTVNIGDSFSYSFSTKNTGKSTITAITVYEHLFSHDGTLVAYQTHRSGFNLYASQTENFISVKTDPLSGAVNNQITLIITAVGYGPLENQVQGSAQHLITLTSAPSDPGDPFDSGDPSIPVII